MLTLVYDLEDSTEYYYTNTFIYPTIKNHSFKTGYSNAQKTRKWLSKSKQKTITSSHLMYYLSTENKNDNLQARFIYSK